MMLPKKQPSLSQLSQLDGGASHSRAEKTWLSSGAAWAPTGGSSGGAAAEDPPVRVVLEGLQPVKPSAKTSSSSWRRTPGKLDVVEILPDGSRRAMTLRPRDLMKRIEAATTPCITEIQNVAASSSDEEADREEDASPTASTGTGTGTTTKKYPTGGPSKASGKKHERAQKGQRQRQQLARGHHHRSLLARDLRSMDPSFTQKAAHPAIVVRRDVILANFEPLRVVILHDRMLTLLPHNPEKTTNGVVVASENHSQRHQLVDELVAQLRLASAAIVHVDSDDSLATNAAVESAVAAHLERKSLVAAVGVVREDVLFGHDNDMTGSYSGGGEDKDVKGAAETITKEGTEGGVLGAPTSAGQDQTSRQTALPRAVYFDDDFDEDFDNDDEDLSCDEDDLEHGRRRGRRRRDRTSGGPKGPLQRAAEEGPRSSRSSPLAAPGGGGGGGDPFELRALEAVLACATRRLSSDLDRLSPLAKESTELLRTSRMSLEHLERLRRVKNEVSYQETRARDTAEALEAVLDEDEDMCLMHLTKLRAAPGLFEPPLSPALLTDHEDVELLLENYLQHTTTTQTALELLRLHIDNAEDLFSMKLDISRNRLITADTIFTLLSMIAAVMALVAGLFGMNLDSEKPSFLLVTLCILVGGLVVAALVFAKLFKSNTLVF